MSLSNETPETNGTVSSAESEAGRPHAPRCPHGSGKARQHDCARYVVRRLSVDVLLMRVGFELVPGRRTRERLRHGYMQHVCTACSDARGVRVRRQCLGDVIFVELDLVEPPIPAAVARAP